MLDYNGIGKVSAAIRSASTSMESRFLEIGSRLGTAVATIKTLTDTFDLLAEELKGDNLRDAAHELSQIMNRVAALANASTGEQQTFAELEKLTAGIQRRVLQMGKAVRGIHMLAMNSRIEAASIGEAGLDFAGFATEIGGTLQRAQDSLNQFTRELGAVGRHLRTASATQRAVAQHQGAAIRSIPVRLAASVASITDRGKLAVASASSVADRSREVAKRINSAVMALQVGDSTRQRLEHVEYAFGVVTEILTSSGGDWAALDLGQRHALAAFCCHLQSAQLLDTADKFDIEVARILASVRDLAVDAQEILQLGNRAAGAGDRRGTFLGGVEEQVAEVDALLKVLGSARREADQVAATVGVATTRLVSHTRTLSFLEGDIRIMGLNTSLKCGRLGSIGRPLSIIAQELRIYANQIATEAGAVTTSLDQVIVIANSLSGDEQERGVSDVASVTESMGNSVARLRTAGQSLADALATLQSNTESVAGLLRETVQRAAAHEELSRVLRQAAAELASLVAERNSEVVATIEAGRVLDLFSSSYTMDVERVVHDRYSNRKPTAKGLVVSHATSYNTLSKDAADGEFDDLLF